VDTNFKMPIDYKEYHPKWSLIRKLILRRANGKCEWCDVVNHSWIDKITRELCLQDEDNAIRVVLTIAHVDHNKNNNRFNNLAALCQKCHLGHDRDQHGANRKYGKRKNQINLFTKNKST